MRSADGAEEVGLESYEHFASRDPLTDLVFERIMAGVSARGCYERTNEPVGEQTEAEASATGKSTVSREFIARTRSALGELMARRLDDVRLAALTLDGLEISGRTHVVCLGISTDGAKIALGLWDGATENATVARALLSDLVDRGLDPEQGILFVIDGSKALAKAIRDVFGTAAPLQRCVRHKERNVLDHLPEAEREPVKAKLRQAWALGDHQAAIERLRSLAGELCRSHPGAATSLREGLEVTVQRLGASEQLRTTLASTNPCESMIEIVRRIQRNVKRWGKRRHADALDRGRDGGGRAAVPAHHRLARPGQPRRCGRARARPVAAGRDRARGGPSARCGVIVNSGSPSKFHGDRDIIDRQSRGPGWRSGSGFRGAVRSAAPVERRSEIEIYSESPAASRASSGSK